MTMFQTGPLKKDLLKKKQCYTAMTLRQVLPLAQTVQGKGELRTRVNGLMDLLRRVHETFCSKRRTIPEGDESPGRKRDPGFS